VATFCVIGKLDSAIVGVRDRWEVASSPRFIRLIAITIRRCHRGTERVQNIDKPSKASYHTPLLTLHRSDENPSPEKMLDSAGGDTLCGNVLEKLYCYVKESPGRISVL
jgi:hypothetical protein